MGQGELGKGRGEKGVNGGVKMREKTILFELFRDLFNYVDSFGESVTNGIWKVMNVKGCACDI